MPPDISVQLASILGPVLMVVSSAEFLNYRIYSKIDPPVVSLNGLILLIGGMTIIHFHNTWAMNWTVLITGLGWLILLAGLYRLYFPSGQQLKRTKLTTLFLLILFLIGSFLAFKSYY